MPRFFIEPTPADHFQLTGDDARHVIKSLRMREGEALTLCDGSGVDYHSVIEGFCGDDVLVRVLSREKTGSEPAVKVTLYQALPKGEKFDFIIQKAVELGVHAIVPVLTERCVSRPDSKSMAKKLLRLQRIALEAAKQSGRGIIPEIRPLISFREAVAGMKQADRAILFYEGATEPLSAFLQGGVPDGDEIAILIGSEGGFSPEEADYAAQQGAFPASLGRRILRCETAPICALSAIFYACGEF